MPSFETDNIDPSDYISECSHREIKQLIQVLVDDGYISQAQTEVVEDDKVGTSDDFYECVRKLYRNKHLLTIQEEELIFSIVNRLI